MLIVTIKLLVHTKYWSWYFIFSIIFCSLGLYIGYMWFSNYKAILNNHILGNFLIMLFNLRYFSHKLLIFSFLGTVYIMWHNPKTIFYLILCAILIIVVDTVHVAVDFYLGGYVSKMRMAIK